MAGAQPINSSQPDPGEQPARPRYRPPIGIPVENARPVRSLLVAILLHVAVIVLLIIPFTSPELLRSVMGAGGIGPAGGGGGGSQGAGGRRIEERLQFVRVAPAPAPTPAVPVPPRPQVVPPITPPPKPVVPPATTPTPATPPTPAPAASANAVPAAGTGTGTGTGNDGSGGTGPGSGGGVGSGVGTGRGSAVGAGTGGGPGSIYPPAPIELPLPPMPVPKKAKGTTILVVFDVDSTGKILDLQFSPTKDGDYNRKLRESLIAIRFRPAVNAQGVPVRARAEIAYSL